MDSEAIARIAVLTESIVRDIRRYNDFRYKQRIESERLTIEVQAQEAAEVKASKLLTEKIQRSEKLRELEQERAKIQREAIDYLKKGLFWTGVQLSRAFPALLVMTLCGAFGCGFGIFIGLNIPTTAACPTVRSWCYHLRINKWATIAPEIPVPDKPAASLKKKTRKRF